MCVDKINTRKERGFHSCFAAVSLHHPHQVRRAQSALLRDVVPIQLCFSVILARGKAYITARVCIPSAQHLEGQVRPQRVPYLLLDELDCCTLRRALVLRSLVNVSTCSRLASSGQSRVGPCLRRLRVIAVTTRILTPIVRDMGC